MSETELLDKEKEKEQEQEEEQEQTKDIDKKDLEKDPIVIKAKSLELPALFEFIKDLDNQYNAYVTGIKAILIRIAAEKLEERGMTAVSNIVDEIAEKLAGSKIPITARYIRMCIPQHLKKVTRATRTKQQEEFKSDEDIEREHIKESTHIPEIADENDLEITKDRVLSQQQQQDQSEILERLEKAEEKVRLLEKVVKSKDGEIPYIEAIETIRVIKWDKYKVNEIDAAYKNSLKEVIFKVDIRTSKLVAAITDKQFNKEQNNVIKK